MHEVCSFSCHNDHDVKTDTSDNQHGNSLEKNGGLSNAFNFSKEACRGSMLIFNLQVIQ